MDFNMWEIAALVVLAIIVFGPEKLPELARKAARVLNYLRRIGNDARGQLRQELGDEFADISLADLNPKTFVAKHLLSGEEVEDLRQIRDEALATGQIVRDTVDEVKGVERKGDDEDANDEAAPVVDAPAEQPGGATAADRAEPTASPAGERRTTVPFDPEAT